MTARQTVDNVELLRGFAEFLKSRYDFHVRDGSCAAPSVAVDPDARELAKTFLAEPRSETEQEDGRVE